MFIIIIIIIIIIVVVVVIGKRSMAYELHFLLATYTVHLNTRDPRETMYSDTKITISLKNELKRDQFSYT